MNYVVYFTIFPLYWCFLIYMHKSVARSKRTWKYIVQKSVNIALIENTLEPDINVNF